MRNVRKWEDWEIELLKEYYPKQDGFTFLKKTLNRKQRTIQSKALKLGLKRNRFQTATESVDIKYVKTLIKSGKTINEVAKIFNIHPSTMKKFCLNNRYNYLEDYGEIQNKSGWRKLDKGHSGFIRLFNGYKKSAENRGFDFNLTEAEFRQFTKQNCYYCGIEPNSTMYSGGQSSKWSEYIYNGIDRVDNNIGYKFENCVTCCGVCNLMKRDLSYDKFINKIITIAKRHKKDGILCS